MAEAVVVGTDLPVKRPREGEENGGAVYSVDMAEDKDSSQYNISSVIPGWFSEISPMWPGLFLST